MFVGQLSGAQKELILDAAIHLSSADDDFSNYEKATIDQMCLEMQVPVRYQAKLDLDAVLEEFKRIESVREKRIILIELAGIVLADRIYDTREKDVLLRITTSLGFQSEKANEAIDLVKEYFGIFDKISKYLQE